MKYQRAEDSGSTKWSGDKRETKDLLMNAFAREQERTQEKRHEGILLVLWSITKSESEERQKGED